MDAEYRKIRSRYDDVLCCVLDPDMLRDVMSLLRYIEQLHELMAHYAVAAQGAMALAEPLPGQRVH